MSVLSDPWNAADRRLCQGLRVRTGHLIYGGPHDHKSCLGKFTLFNAYLDLEVPHPGFLRLLFGQRPVPQGYLEAAQTLCPMFGEIDQGNR